MLAEANARLRGEQDFIVASTRYLGHYVVGRLAGRLGIDVELNTSPVSGIVARLLLPSSLIVDESSSGRGDSGGARMGRQSTGSHDDVNGSPDDARHSRGQLAASGVDRVPEPPRRGARHNASDREGAGRPDDRHPEPGRNDARVPDLDEQGGRRSESGRNGARVPDLDQQGAHISMPMPMPTPMPTPNGSPPNFDQHDGRQLRVDPLNGHHAAQQPVVLPAEPPGADQGSPAVPSPYIQFLTGTGATARSGLNLSQEPRGTRGEGVGGDLDVPGQASVERTRNGMVKRTKRATPSDRPRREAPLRDRPPVTERTPDQTRSMLAAFRTGHESGSGTSEDHPIR
ncbi:hypothetical protein [Nocardia coubleae]|uniref:hypothetical protein n=1 Tax=Nocardia coubleae TaxID=356147 RepID=UPI0008302294|nr:hypothetical protein [Nocardia coubleae]